MIGARLLNLPTAHTREDAGLIEALFQIPPDRPPEGASAWDDLRMKCFEYRANLRDELLARTGVRQGGADTIFAVDTTRLLEALRRVKADWNSKTPLPKHRSSEDSVQRIEVHTKDLARRLQLAITQRRDDILSKGEHIRSELGEEFNKQQIVENLTKVIQVTRQFAVADPQDKLGTLTTLVENFRDAAVTQCLQHLKRIVEETEGGALLSALAQVDDDTLSIVGRFVSDIAGFLDRTEKVINGQLAVLGENIVETAIERLDAQLKAIQEAIPKPKQGNA